MYASIGAQMLALILGKPRRRNRLSLSSLAELAGKDQGNSPGRGLSAAVPGQPEVALAVMTPVRYPGARR